MIKTSIIFVFFFFILYKFEKYCKHEESSDYGKWLLDIFNTLINVPVWNFKMLRRHLLGLWRLYYRTLLAFFGSPDDQFDGYLLTCGHFGLTSEEIVSVLHQNEEGIESAHCREEGCVGKSIPRGRRDLRGRLNICTDILLDEKNWFCCPGLDSKFLSLGMRFPVTLPKTQDALRFAIHPHLHCVWWTLSMQW